MNRPSLPRVSELVLPHTETEADCATPPSTRTAKLSDDREHPHNSIASATIDHLFMVGGCPDHRTSATGRKPSFSWGHPRVPWVEFVFLIGLLQQLAVVILMFLRLVQSGRQGVGAEEPTGP